MQIRNAWPVVALVVSLLSTGCFAKVKVETVRRELAKGAIGRGDVVHVRPFDCEKTRFEGDKKDDQQRIGEEKEAIRAKLPPLIVQELKDEELSGAVAGDQVPADAVVLEGVVTRYDHGSGAARAMAGWGAGASELFMTIRIWRGSKEKVLADFDIKATSNVKGGMFAGGSWLNDHLSDTADWLAEYLADHAN